MCNFITMGRWAVVEWDFIFYDVECNRICFIIISSFKIVYRALGLPTSDLTYDDCKLMIRGRQMNLPHHDDIVEIEKLRQEIGYVEIKKKSIEFDRILKIFGFVVIYKPWPIFSLLLSLSFM